MNRLTYSPPTGYVVTQPKDKKLKLYHLGRPESTGSFNNLTFPTSLSKLRPIYTYGGDSLRLFQTQRLPQDGKPPRPAFTRIFEGPINNDDHARPVFSLDCPDDCFQTTPNPRIQEDEFGAVDSQPFLSRAVSYYGRNSGSALQRLNSRRMSRSLPELREYKIIPLPPTVDETEQESDEDEDFVYEAHTKSNWHRKLDFVLCVVCQTLGLNSLWRFPYYCYQNGGGSFLLAYLIMLILCGIPLLCMELAVGQITQSGPIAALGQLCPLMKGVGFSCIIASFLLTTYYSVLVGWTLFYLFNSFFSLPRWITCESAWNTDRCWNGFISFQSLDSNYNKDHISSLVDDKTNNTSSMTTVDIESIPAMSLETFVNHFTSTFNSTQEALTLPKSIQNYTLSSQEFFDWKLISMSGEIEKLGDLRFELMAAVLFTWILVYFALRKATFFKGRTVYVLSIMCHVVLLSLFVRIFFLEGSLKGLHYLFKPHWETLGTAKVWLYALVQVMHSLGIVLGSSIAVGSFNKQQNNIFRDTFILAFITVLTVVIISCIVFGTLGHISAKMEKSLDLILHKDPGLPFVIYSVAIGTMPIPSLWGTFFFIMFFWLGMEYQVKLVAVIVTSLEESYSHFIKQRFQGHSLFLFIICIVGFLSSFLYFTQAGIYFFQVTDYYIAVLIVPIIAILEIIAISWIYGTKKLSSSINKNIGEEPSAYFQTCWLFVSPLVLVAVTIFNIVTTPKLGNDTVNSYVGKGVGWFLFAFTLSWILIIGVNIFRKTPKSNFFARVLSSIEPNQHTEPLHLWDPKPLIVLNAVPYVGNEDDEKEEQLPQLSQQAAPFLASKNTRETAI